MIKATGSIPQNVSFAVKSSIAREFLEAKRVVSMIDLLAIQIDGLRVGDHVLVAAIGIDGAGDKHVLAVALGATENAAVEYEAEIQLSAHACS
jgi:hypothetical protein